MIQPGVVCPFPQEVHSGIVLTENQLFFPVLKRDSIHCLIFKHAATGQGWWALQLDPGVFEGMGAQSLVSTDHAVMANNAMSHYAFHRGTGDAEQNRKEAALLDEKDKFKVVVENQIDTSKTGSVPFSGHFNKALNKSGDE